MTKATQWRIFGTVATVLFLWAAVRSAVPKGSEWIAIGLIAVATTMLWTGREGKLYKMLTAGLITVVAWLFLSVWSPTKATVDWFSSRVALNAPRNNFDPKSGTAIMGVVVCKDGKVIREMPLEYNFDPDTGCPVKPMTPELAEELKKLEHSEKPKSAPTAASSTPTKTQWCFSKPPGVKGYKPSLRATCLEAHIDTDTDSVLSFTVFHRHGGERQSSSFFLDRVSGTGKWRNNGDLPGHGDWFEQPTVPSPGMKVLGQFRDATEDNLWQTFYIQGGTGDATATEERPTPPPIPPIFQVRNPSS